MGEAEVEVEASLLAAERAQASDRGRDRRVNAVKWAAKRRSCHINAFA